MPTQPLYDFGGTGPLLHMAVANGFPPQAYKLLLEPLTVHYHVVSLPPRALWPGIGAPPEDIGDWRELADDLLAGIAHYDLKDIVAIGHSFGAIASMLAAIEQPQRFRALVMLDPTILPPLIMNAFRAARKQGEIPRFPLIEGAQKRKDLFDSLDEAFEYWRGKPLFHDWSDEALWLYTKSMTRPAANGGLELSWPRDWEAYYYMAFYLDSWDDLAKLRGLLPTLIIRAQHSDAYIKEAADVAETVLPDATHVTLPGVGHLFPQAAPDATRQIISDWLEGLR
jgi:pimeloyl-ACP methyl ester carboxylesterase